MHYRLCIAIALALAAVSSARAALTFGPNEFYTEKKITFDSTMTDVNNGPFTGQGFAPVPGAGQLDSDTWALSGFAQGTDGGDVPFGGSGAAGTDPGRGIGLGTSTPIGNPTAAQIASVSQGGVYGFDVDNDYTAGVVNRALGFQPTGDDFTNIPGGGRSPGHITLKVLNNTGYDALQWDVSYDILYRNDENRSSFFNFSYSLDGLTFNPVGSVDFTSPEAETPEVAPWVTVTKTLSILAGVASGDNIYFRWSSGDVAGSGSRDLLALDNISITAIPEPAAMAFGGLACCLFAVGYYGKGRLYGTTEESQESVA